MSTNLKTIASVMPATQAVPFTNVSRMELTRFSGKDGMKLQVTIKSGVLGFAPANIHLNKAQIKNLINTLQDAFDLTNEPDCDQDEEILSDCCSSERSLLNNELCNECLEPAEFI